MQAGQLRHRITVQQRSQSADDSGQLIDSWSTLAILWARIRWLSGREYIAARQAQADVKVEITIRQRDDIHERMRVSWGSHIYDIEAILPDETNNRQLTMLCSEVVS